MATGQQRCSCGRAQRIEILIVHWHPFVLSKILLLRQQSALAQSMAGRLQALAPRVLVCYHSQGEREIEWERKFESLSRDLTSDT